MTDATPRPWRVNENGWIYATVGDDPNVCIGKAYDAPSGDYGGPAMDANAALIVRAVNRDHLFEEVVAALKHIAELQEDKCQTASAEMLYALLYLKVGVARATLTKIAELGDEG